MHSASARIPFRTLALPALAWLAACAAMTALAPTATAADLAAPAGPAAGYSVLARWPVPGKGTRFDYLYADPVDHRLYVSHDTRFEVLDLDTGMSIGQVGPSARAHGVALSHETGRGFATSGADNSILLFDLKTLAILKRIPSPGKGPDCVRYDPASHRVFVANHGSGDLTVLDPATGAVLGTTHLGGKLEEIGFDGRGHAFVNAEDASSVHVVDTRSLALLATWKLAPGEGGTGLAVDQAHHRLFSACGNEQVVVLDSDTGRVVATPAVGEDPDGVAFDPSTGLIFSPNVDGTLTVIHEDGPDTYSVIQTVKTRHGSRTIALDPSSGRLFTCSSLYGPKPAPTADVPSPKTPALPGTLEVWVVGRP